MDKTELLAPAGSFETLRAVLAAGADAVYVGGSRFGARAYAKNFTTDELKDAIDYTHFMGKKLHLTVNTLLKNRELEEQLYTYFLPFYEQGVDAVIVQDAGVFSFIRQYFPEVELHVSTQMTVTGADGARFWKEAGARRIVLARELSLSEIRHIHEQTDIELECFAHGALCYCYSGQCLFSSMLGGRSGNRGALCAALPAALRGGGRGKRRGDDEGCEGGQIGRMQGRRGKAGGQGGDVPAEPEGSVCARPAAGTSSGGRLLLKDRGPYEAGRICGGCNGDLPEIFRPSGDKGQSGFCSCRVGQAAPAGAWQPERLYERLSDRRDGAGDDQPEIAEAHGG